MKTTIQKIFIPFLCLLFSNPTFAQTAGTAVCMEISNLVLTAPNEFTFDVNLRNTGTTTLELRGYSGGINVTPGFANGGNIVVSFLSRDPILNSIPAVTPNYASSIQHFRFTTTNAVAGNEVALTPMLPYRLGTFKMATSTNFNPLLGAGYDPFNPIAPATPMQVLEESGKTDCEVNCIVNPTPGSDVTYHLVGTGVTPANLYTLPTLTASYNSWGSCGSVPATIGEHPATFNYSITHNVSYSDLTLQSDQPFEKLTIGIYNLKGQLIQEKKNLSGSSCSFDLSHQPKGVYIIQIKNSQRKESIKFVKD